MTDQVSRPVQILLAVTVLFAGLWFVALRPKSASNSGGSSASAPTTTSAAPAAPGAAGLGRAIDKAHGAVAGSDADAAKLGAASAAAASGGDPSVATAPSTGAPPATGAAPVAPATTAPSTTVPPATGAAATAATTPAAARAARALQSHRVLAVLFYNPRASDDRAVLRAFHRLGVRGVTFVAAPLSELGAFRAVTQRVAVTGSPTFVAFDRAGTATTLVGFSDPALMGQRLADAHAGH